MELIFLNTKPCCDVPGKITGGASSKLSSLCFFLLVPPPSPSRYAKRITTTVRDTHMLLPKRSRWRRCSGRHKERKDCGERSYYYDFFAPDRPLSSILTTPLVLSGYPSDNYIALNFENDNVRNFIMIDCSFEA
ncbi:hypothetical protein Ahy_A08g039240 isoform B [Arachis hypogaea]|uniref:Uncharacterized protein n=1 Tax=Arachis hypogaea TaxID=3818 RepID=A0A445BVP6_ARAHY|nr:hypothetical protein Ahy_A08g039240 isoform B [Arachis hypogaea]